MNQESKLEPGALRVLIAAGLGFGLAAILMLAVNINGVISLAIGIAATAAVCLVPLRRRDAGGSGSANASAELGSGLPALALALFEHLPDPLMLLDQAERVLFANAPAHAVVGSGIEGKHVSAVLRTPSVLEAIQLVSRSGKPTSVGFSFHVPVERHFEAYAARVETSPALVVLVLHEVTQLKRSEQMRVDFVANASHELRTPLAAVSGFIETLKGHAREDTKAREKFLDIMTVEADRMRRLIDDLLSLSRIELNEHVPPLGEVSIEGVVRDVAGALAPLARAENITIEIEKRTELPPVTGERDELIQLFQNLLHNAIKYGRTDGHVWITLGALPADSRQLQDMVAVSVRDDGEGIPAEAIPRLTERFYRVDVKRSREKGGTGLGLAIVKHIINRHQGRLQIESQTGEGATFTVTIPAARSVVADPPSAIAAK